MITVEGVVCPTCGPVTIGYDPEEEIQIPPTNGICPMCGHMLHWIAEGMYLGRFEPAGVKKGESPIAEVKITLKDPP